MKTQVLNKRKKRKLSLVKNSPDILLVIPIILLLGFGIIMVYSASFYHSTKLFGSPSYLAIKQLFIGIGGACIMFLIAYKLNYRIFINPIISGIVYGISILLLLLLPFIGTETNGSTRWIYLPFGLSIQPSEIAKIGLILFLSSYLYHHKNKLNQIKYIALAWLIVIVPVGLISLENLSSGIVVGIIGAVLIYMCSPKTKYFFIIGALGFMFIWFIYNLAMTTPRGVDISSFLKSYRLDRIRVWKDPWLDPLGVGYQPIQSLRAIGSGGMSGLGLGKSIQKMGSLPEPHNDIIFAIICEELGIWGAAAVLITYSVIVLRGLWISTKLNNLFGSLVMIGISVLLGSQAVLNVAVATGAMPNTGMQLPLISYGGTALLILLATLGIGLNISRHVSTTKRTTRNIS